VWYYSTSRQLDELLLVLDAETYEHDLVQVIVEMREEIDKQMAVTEQLTKAVQAGRKSVIDVLNGIYHRHFRFFLFICLLKIAQ